MRTHADRDDYGLDENFKLALGVVSGCVLFLGLIMLALSVQSVNLKLGLLLFTLPAPALPVALAVRGSRPHDGHPRKRLSESSQKPAWSLAALFLAGSVWMLFFFDGSTTAQCGMGSFLYTAAWAAGIYAYSRDRSIGERHGH